jgi:signal transduction histidine kinase
MPATLFRALACLGLALVLPLKAQVLGDFPVRRYGTDQGLSSEVVSAMVQDLNGRLWIGTEGGLNYFDGRRFSQYAGPLPPGFVVSLAVARDGALWVATDGGLARIEQGRSRLFGEADGIPSGPVQEVVQNAEGRIWVLTSQGIRVGKDSGGFVIPGPWPGSEPPANLFADPSLPGVWAITPHTIWFWQQGAWVPVDSPRLAPGEIFQDISVDGARNLLIRSSNSLWRLPAGGSRPWIGTRMVGGYSHISKLSRDAEGWVWVDTAAGLWRVQGDRQEQFGHAQDNARGGMVDSEGGLWLRTDLGVLRVLGQTRWHAYGHREDLPLDTTWQMIRDHQGHLWVGADSGLWVEQGCRFKRVVPGRFLNLTLGKGDVLWATGSPGGTVHAVDTRTLVDQAIRIEALPVARITAGLAVDAEGHPWVADERGGLVRGSRAGRGWTWATMQAEGPPPREVRDLRALPGGEILLLHDQSVSIWCKGTWHQVPDLLPELPYIAAIASDGQVIIGYKTHPALTLHRLQGDNLIRTGMLDCTVPGKNMVLYSVAAGTGGRLWVGTSAGLGYVDKDENSFRLLGSEDRIVSPECDQGAILVEPNRIWIGTPSGLMSYDPLPHPAKQELRPPLILSARVAARELDLFNSAVAELPRDHNELEIQFMVPNYQVQDTLLYAAKLSGVDSDWIRLDTPYLRYAGLQAGPHVLELRGLTRQGLQGPVTTFHFRVLPAWWERGWVRILGLLGLAGMVMVMVKVRQTRLEHHNRELLDEVARQTSALVAASKAKSAFLANMSHELRTPLNAILLYSEILQEDMKDPALDGLRHDAVKIQGAGRHLLGLIDDILDVSKIEAGRLRLELREIELQGFLHDLDATVRPLVEKNRNRFEVEVLNAPDHIYSDPTRLRQVLVNLLSNSAKFTKDGQVILRIWSEGDHLLMLVQDSGIGMTQEQQLKVFEEFEQADESTTRKFGGTGLGLTLVKKFTGLLGGEIALHSTPGQGTTFTLKIPRSGPPPGTSFGTGMAEAPSKIS